MVYNKLMDSFRKSSKKNDVLVSYHKTFLDEIVQEEDKSEDGNESKLSKLNQCIDQLPKRCKNVFRNKKIKGLSNKEIASNFNISIKTVEAHMTKAYVFLRTCIKPLSGLQ